MSAENINRAHETNEYKTPIINEGVLSQKHNLINKSSSVLEIGCFIGDLLYHLKKDYKCNVVGIEPSSKAVNYCKSKYNISLENTSFINSQFAKNINLQTQSFDLIILDDVLSWMDRKTILNVIYLIDKLLLPGGYLMIRDFTPSFSFSYLNHHVKDKSVSNFKISKGHKEFFLLSGMYMIVEEYIRTDSRFQKSTTNRPDSSTWSDCLLRKNEFNLYPLLPL